MRTEQNQRRKQESTEKGNALTWGPGDQEAWGRERGWRGQPWEQGGLFLPLQLGGKASENTENAMIASFICKLEGNKCAPKAEAWTQNQCSSNGLGPTGRSPSDCPGESNNRWASKIMWRCLGLDTDCKVICHREILEIFGRILVKGVKWRARWLYSLPVKSEITATGWLTQGLTNVFCKGPDGEYFRLCWP